MSSTRKALAFRLYVEQAFEAAAQDFKENPSANNWLDLKVAMWAWQHVQGMTETLQDAAHIHLCEVASRAKGDFNFSEGE